MTIYLVRHAHAGSRKKWVGRDELRPLSDRGWAQADGLASTLADAGIAQLWSSPFTRCVQTLEPLARKTHVDIDTHPALAEGAPVTLTLALLDAHLYGTAAFCTHGDVAEIAIDALARRGVAVDTSVDTRKGGWWTIDAEGSRFTRGTYHPPVGA